MNVLFFSQSEIPHFMAIYKNCYNYSGCMQSAAFWKVNSMTEAVNISSATNMVSHPETGFFCSKGVTA
jgi:hypothetical protein